MKHTMSLFPDIGSAVPVIVAIDWSRHPLLPEALAL